MRCRRHPRPAFQDYRNGLITCQLISGNNKKAQVCTSLYTPVLSDGCGSGGWIRTTDLRVMSPTSCHCSTPRCCGARTYSPGGRPASTIGAAAFHDPVRDGTGWVRGASRTPLVQGGGSALLLHVCSACTSGAPAGKPSSMRTPRLYPSRGLQLAPPSRSSAGGLTGLLP